MRYESKTISIVGAITALLLIFCIMLAACAGPQGPSGPQGPAGPSGPSGTPGKDATARPISITVTPSTIEPAVRFKSLKVAGSGFIPGELVEIYLWKAVPVVEGGEKVNAAFDTSIPVNEQGAFVANASFSLLASLEEGTYTLIAEGTEGSMTTYPLVVKAAE
ncbi:hypothetical protein ACFLU4_08045 [Chloroflexota bacterium]